MTKRQFLNIVEMRTKVISMGTFACASLYAVNIQDSVPIVPWVIMGGFATLFVDMGTTGFNTFFDYYRGTDNLTYTKEKEKVLVHETVNPLSALLISFALFALAAVLGLILASMTSWYLILVGGLCMLVGFFLYGWTLADQQNAVWRIVCWRFSWQYPVLDNTLRPGCSSRRGGRGGCNSSVPAVNRYDSLGK